MRVLRSDFSIELLMFTSLHPVSQRGKVLKKTRYEYVFFFIYEKICSIDHLRKQF